MSDPFAVFPQDEEARLRGGFFKAFKYEDVNEALAHGWVRGEPAIRHPLEDYGIWLHWPHRGEMPWLPD